MSNSRLANCVLGSTVDIYSPSCAKTAFRKEIQERVCVGLLVETFGLLLLSEGIFSLSLLGHLTATPTSVCCFASERHKHIKNFKKTCNTHSTQTYQIGSQGNGG